MIAPALKINELRAGYKKLPIVNGVSFEIAAGELVTLFGRNGVGKTTTLNAIGGCRYGMNSGSVCVDGVELATSTPDRIAAARLALVPEGRRLFTEMTVRENLEMGAFPLGRQRASVMRDLFDQVFDLFPGLADKQQDPVSSLSGGQQQMVAVAQALMSKPKVMVLDEPTAGIAPILCDLLYKALLELKQLGLAILIVDQLVDRGLHYGDRFLIMDDGLLVDGGNCASPDARRRIERVLLAEAIA